MDEIKIRDLTAGDVAAAAQIRVDGWRKAYRGIVDDDFLDSLDVTTQVQRFADCIGSDNFIVAILDGETVGFCRFVYDNSFSPDIDYIDCELTAIYVRPDLKRKGIGKKMFEEVVKRFKDKNKTTMIVWCLAGNANSIKFYEHMGGEIKEKRMIDVGGKQYEEVGIVYDLNI